VSLHPDRTHILEGDLCWDFTSGREEFYFRHPSYVFDRLSPELIQQGLKKRELVSLTDLDLVRATKTFLVVELKIGRGDHNLALRKLITYLEKNFENRYWIDGFSLPMLEYIKGMSPRTPVTLHTELVYHQHVLVAAPEWPPVRIRRLSTLTFLDGVAIRKRGSEAFMARACRDVHAASKPLILSRLHTLRDFECSKLWGARAGYIHGDFERLLELNDEIDARAGVASYSAA
jgi:hypothetical protein